MLKIKKGVSTIISIGLLLLVVTSAMIFFQIRFDFINNSLLVDIEKENSLKDFRIDSIVGSNLTLFLEGETEILSIKIENRTCSFSGFLQTGINRINISDCLENKRRHDIVIVTSSGVFSESVSLIGN